MRQTEETLIPAMRIFFALLALLAVRIHAPEAIDGLQLVTTLLLCYAFYSVLVYLWSRLGGPVAVTLQAWSHWADVAWYMAVVYLSREAGSVFFIGFLFPIIAASFRWGLVSGLRVTSVSVVSVALLSAVPMPGLEAGVSLKVVLWKSAWLLGLGYLMARWGESEVLNRRRLALVDAVTNLSNPRFGIDRTVASMLNRLRDHYGADSSLIVLADPENAGFLIQRACPQKPQGDVHLEPAAPQLARRLLELPPERAAVHNGRSEGWWRFGRIDGTLDVSTGKTGRVGRSAFAPLAAILDAHAFVTVPVRFHKVGKGRLYVVAARPAFVASDMHFLLHVLGHISPVIENIRLVEQLSEHAADEERQKIARDIHDSVIQPYLGLQMGLEALHQKAASRFPEISAQLEQLMELAGAGVTDLRNCVSGLKTGNGGHGCLLPAMRRFAEKFTDATGIAVQIETEGEIHASGRLAAEAFQLMAEGLSNVRKHTHSVRATVRLACRSGHLIVVIMNECSEGSTTGVFNPASITERAESLGGTVKVAVLPQGGSSVTVDIPL